MTRRPSLSTKSRPLSAIFLGSVPGSSPPSIPDLPEPPSPSSSNASGLPSPPATNSTGSDSIGDRSNAGSIRQRSASCSISTSQMTNGAYDKSYSSRIRNSNSDDEDDSYDHDNDEDYTAKLSDGRRATPKTPVSDNMSALQRVKNLTQRNRMVLDKLTSISRHNSPAPGNNARSPFSPPPAASSSSSSSHPSARARPQSTSDVPINNARPFDSGSETERESQHFSNHSYPSSEDLSETPPLMTSEIRAPIPTRQRRISAPASPGKAMRPTQDRDRGPSPGPSRRKRVSMLAAGEHNYDQREDEENVVMAAALAAVASSRRSPGGAGKKTRQPLPREFIERDRRSLDGKPVGEPPSTPHRHPDRNYLGRASPSPKASGSGSNLQTSPRRLGASRYSTVRELTRKHQTRWLSEDLSAFVDVDDEPPTPQTNGGRRQGHRLGSSEGMVPGIGGRSLVGEGLRAAGLTKRRELGEDVFVVADESQAPRRTKSTGNSSIVQTEWDSPVEQTRGAGPSTRVGENMGPLHRYDPRTPAAPLQRQNDRGNYTALTRPGTSMAALHHESPDNPPPRTAPPALRAYRSAYPLDKSAPQLSDRESAQDAPSAGRGLGTPFGTLRSTTLPPGGMSNSTRDQSAEHRRLMLESLGMFEGQLSRLPPMGQTTTSTIPDLFQSAQHLVHTLDKLNGMLKAGTNNALEAQIETEVADHQDGVDLAELWRVVGSEHRENLRASDEVVRNMTGFLLGVGRVLREAVALGGHLRSVSLDDEATMTRRMTPEVGSSVGSGGRASDGRKSRETRRSWDPSPRTPAELLRRASSRERGQRPGSSQNMTRSSGTSSSESRSNADAVGEQTPQTVRNAGGSGLLPSSSVARRLYTARERATPESISVHDPATPFFSPQDSLVSHEPSPTPASRYSAAPVHPERYRSPVAIAPSLSTLPSESLLSRSNTVGTDKPSRRKISSNSNITVRAEPSALSSVIRPPNTTTAVTATTVSHSPDKSYAPLRSDSRMNGVTFSRSSTISVSTLSGLHQQHERERERTISTTSSADEHALEPAAVISPVPGYGAERDSRYRTLGGRPRISLDAAMEEAERNAGSTSRASTLSTARRERRRTITEIFSQR